MIVGLPGPHLTEKDRAMLRTVRPAGVCLYRPNIESSGQVRALVAEVKALYPHGLEPFIAVDEEGGTVSRLAPGMFQLPGAMAVGAAGSADLAEEAGRGLGTFLTGLGIDVDFAPVLEPATNPASRTIGVRAFSDDPDRVAELGAAFAAGLKAGGVLAVAKHFPGHGLAQVDSHFTAPALSERSFDELDASAAAFAAAQRRGCIDGIMIAHATARALTGDDDPITFSRLVLTDYLRARRRFSGVVVTDALVMGSVQRSIPLPRAATRAVAAGADLVLIPAGPFELIHHALMEAISTGAIQPERIASAVARVATFRTAHQTQRTGAGSALDLETPRRVAERAVTVLRNDGKTLPLSKVRRLLVVTTSETFLAAARSLEPRQTLLLPGLGSEIAMPRTSWRPDELAPVAAAAQRADVIVAAVINQEERSLLEILRASDRPLVLVSLGRPLLLDDTSAEALVATYSYTPAAAAAAIAVIRGDIPARGKLPTALPHFPRGTGEPVLR